MHFDFGALPAQTVYNVLTSTVTPRPIAWLTTVSGKGVVNAAPFSFFNVMGHQPPTVAIGLMRHASGELKDSGANIIENGEFVVNLVPESLVAQMNQTCADYPADVDEMTAAGLTALPALSFPYHIGAGIFGGIVPFTATYLAQASGNIFGGLMYPVVVTAVVGVIGSLFLPNTRARAIDEDPAH